MHVFDTKGLQTFLKAAFNHDKVSTRSKTATSLKTATTRRTFQTNFAGFLLILVVLALCHCFYFSQWQKQEERPGGSKELLWRPMPKPKSVEGELRAELQSARQQLHAALHELNRTLNPQNSCCDSGGHSISIFSRHLTDKSSFELPIDLWAPTRALVADPPRDVVGKITRARKVYVTFGHNCCTEVKQRACKAAAPHVDECHALSMSDVEPEFRKAHAKALQAPQGGGLWLWKPYLVNRTLHSVEDGDYVIYVDAGAYLTGPIEPLLVLLERHQPDLGGVLTFGVGLPQSMHCKRDAFVRQRCDTEECHNAMQVNAAFSVWRKGPHALKVVDHWLRDCFDHQSLSEDPNVNGLPNLNDYKSHRHDQALLTNVLTRERWARDTTNHEIAFMIRHDHSTK